MPFLLHSDQSFLLTSQTDSKFISSLSGKKNPRIGFVSASVDTKGKHFKEVASYYESIGFNFCKSLDPMSSQFANELSNADALHLSSGSVFEFLNRLQHNNCQEAIRQFEKDGRLIVGVSAGAMILGASVGLSKLFGEKSKAVSRESLRFLPFDLLPHWNDYSYNTALIERYVKETKITVVPLNDGQSLAVSGVKTKLIEHGLVQKSMLQFIPKS
jgi:dipeptidase E